MTTPENTTPLPRRSRITWASEIEPQPVVWAWKPDGHGRIPAGSLSIAAGREATGKSSCALYLGAQVTRGLLPGSFYGTPRTIFYIAVEDSWAHTLVPRLIAAGADLSRVARFDVVVQKDEEVTLSLPSDNALLEAEIVAHKAAMVIIDPLMSVMGLGVDTHKERDVRTALDPLAKIADRTGALILGIAHFGKSTSADPASLITGSGAFKNVPRAVFGFAKDDTDDGAGRVMTQVKNSLGRDDLPSLSYAIEPVDIPVKSGTTSVGRFTFTGESDRSIMDILRDTRATVGDDDDRTTRHGAAAWLSDYLESQGGKAAKKDVIKAARSEFPERTLQRAMKSPEFTIESSGFPRTTTWCLAVAPDSHDTSGETPDSGATGATTSDLQQHSEAVAPILQSRQSRQSRQVTEAPREGGVTVLASVPGRCPSCEQSTSMGLVPSADGMVCRRCAPGIRKGSRCADCGHPRELVRDGRCNPCHGAAAGIGGAA